MRMRLKLVVGLLAVSGCIMRVREVDVESHSLPLRATLISTPVKAHLRDGTTIVFRYGVQVTATELIGSGDRFDLALRLQGLTTRVPIDSVGALESFREGTNEAASVAASLLGTAAGTIMTGLALVALFGSCPTVYADSAGTVKLQAESFSYSIAPLFEMRDVDGVYGRADASGIVWLELRNEALETHYINHMELLEVRRGIREHLLPDEHGQPILIGATLAPRSATDAAGRSIGHSVATADTSWFASADERITHASESGYSDHIELAFSLPEARDSVALVLSLRNSLLNTVLFYDVMLGAAGARAIDWQGGTLEEIGAASQLGRWYHRRTGMRVSVQQNGTYSEVARIPDVGPIAPKEFALIVPAYGSRDLRIRLDFLADSWRIDYIRVAPAARRAQAGVLPVAHIAHARLADDSASIARLRDPDGDYFITYPGTSVRVGFNAQTPPVSQDSAVSYLLAAQGYYTEWVRADWVKRATKPVLFVPGDAALERTFTRWLEVRRDFESEFFVRRVPVR